MKYLISLILTLQLTFSIDTVEAFNNSRIRRSYGCGEVPLYRGGVEFSDASKLPVVARNHEFPWLVNVWMKARDGTGTRLCGGSLIYSNIVLTNAGCVEIEPYSSLFVKIGEMDVTNPIGIRHFKVTEIIYSGTYVPWKSELNYVFLVIKGDPIRADTRKNINTICLPYRENAFLSNKTSNINYEKCFVSGWVSRSQKSLAFGPVFNIDSSSSSIYYRARKFEVKLLPPSECENYLHESSKSFLNSHSFFWICAEPIKKFHCQEIQGGFPLVCPMVNHPNKYIQIGMLSHNINCNSRSKRDIIVFSNINRLWSSMVKNIKNIRKRPQTFSPHKN